jgi:hypothetical protein
MPPKKYPLKRSKLEDVKRLQFKNHKKWPAAFSTNPRCQIWPYTHCGKTPRNERIFVQGELRTIDDIAQIYSSERPEGGRFFVSDAGAFYSPQYCEQNQFIEFEFQD